MLLRYRQQVRLSFLTGFMRRLQTRATVLWNSRALLGRCQIKALSVSDRILTESLGKQGALPPPDS
jgi:hypothetical protein